jgi:hypothetical protein
MLAAMTSGSSELPVAPLYLGLYLAPHRHGFRLEECERFLGAADRRALGFEEDLELRLTVERRGYGVFASPPDWCEAHLGPSRASVEGGALVRRDGRVCWEDPAGTRHDLAAQPPECIGTWRARRQSLADLPDQVPIGRAEDIARAGHTALTRRIVETIGREHCAAGSVSSPFWGAYELLGFAGLMEAIHDDPDHLLAATARFVPSRLAIVEALHAAGVDMMFVESCLESADMLSPDQFHRFSLPYLRDLLQGIHDLGLPAVLYFCGDPTDRLDDLKGLPCEALAFEEGKKGFDVDIGEVRRRVGGGKTLFGNVDVRLLRDGSARQIEAEVVRQVREAGADGRFVVSIGSPVTLDTPPAKVDMLIEAARTISL